MLTKIDVIDGIALNKSLVETKLDLSRELSAIKNELKFVSQGIYQKFISY